MKILFFITGLNKSGAETQFYNLVHGIKNKKDVQIKVISLHGGYYVDELRKEGVEVVVCTDKLNFNVVKYIKFFKREVESFKPEIVHSFLYHSNIVSKFSMFFMKKNFKFICSYRSLTKKYPFIAFLEYFNMSKADLLISNSKRADLDLNMYSFFKTKRKVINNGFLKKDVTKKSLEKVKTEISKFKKKKIILSVGRLSSEKDYITNIKTCSELAKVRDDFVFFYVGDGKEEASLKQLALKLGVLDKTIFLGKRTDILELLSVSSVFFHPCKYESQSNSIMEAMHMKVPIVTTDLLENHELLKHAEFSKISDYKNMSKQISKILDKGYSKKSLNENFKLIEKNHSFDTMIEKYYKVYKNLL